TMRALERHSGRSRSAALGETQSRRRPSGQLKEDRECLQVFPAIADIFAGLLRCSGAPALRAFSNSRAREVLAHGNKHPARVPPRYKWNLTPHRSEGRPA